MTRRTDLPPMPLCNGCGDCCGPATARPDEIKRIRRFLKDSGESWRVSGEDPFMCGFLRKAEDGTFHCGVYEARPWVCRAFGVIAEMPCQHFPEAVVMSYPTKQAILDRRVGTSDMFLGEAFEPGYLRRIFGVFTEGQAPGVLDLKGKVPGNVARDIVFRTYLTEELIPKYGGPIDTILERMSPDDKKVTISLLERLGTQVAKSKKEAT